MSTGAEVVRHEWADGYRRLEHAREDPARYRALRAQVDAITDQLRRRVGARFELEELVVEYRRWDTSAHDLLPELPEEAQWAAGVTIAVDAAFHLYARGAQDYRP
jgi:hypothetical protein